MRLIVDIAAPLKGETKDGSAYPGPRNCGSRCFGNAGENKNGAAMRPTGPYPILIVTGEQGSAKSTFTALLRRILDPNCAPTRALPRDERDFFIAANNSHILAFDNVSRLPPLLSDTMCRLATGGSFSTRQLHTDREEILIHAARPIICNGIDEFVSRPDLAAPCHSPLSPFRTKSVSRNARSGRNSMHTIR